MRGFALGVMLLAGTVSGGAAQAAPRPPVCPFEIPPEHPPFVLAQNVRDLPADEPLRILAIGSSSTQGFGASRPANAYPAQLAARLQPALAPRPVEVVNAGVGGERASATLARLRAALVEPGPPHLVIWQVGTNDVLFGGTPARLEAVVGEGLAAIAAAKASAIVIDQQYYPGILDLPRYETFVAAVDGPAAAGKVPLLPRYALMKDWAATNKAAFGAILAWDRFHMSDQGYACLADLLAAGILARPATTAEAAAR